MPRIAVGRSPIWRGVGLILIGAMFVLAITTLRRPPASTGPPPNPPSGTSATDTPFLPGAQRLPPPGREATLPVWPTALPATVRLSLATASRLSTDPVPRALALFEVGPPGAGTAGSSQVLVLGKDARLRWLDVVELAPAVDADGNERSPVGATSLSPNGARAAFPQRDRLVVVDLASATVRQIPLPGFNEYVVWLADRVAVAQAGATVVVEPGTGRVTPVPWHGSDLVAEAKTGRPVQELHDSASDLPAVLSWNGSSTTSAAVETPLTSPHWVRPGWAFGDQVAAELVAAPTARASAAVVVGPSGAVQRMLVLSTGTADDRSVGCCSVLGWLDGKNVLVRVRGESEWILGWGTDLGGVFGVCRIDAAGQTLLSVSLAELL